MVNPLNAELNPICHLLALTGGATIVVVSRLRVNYFRQSSCEHLLKLVNNFNIETSRVSDFKQVY